MKVAFLRPRHPGTDYGACATSTRNTLRSRYPPPAVRRAVLERFAEYRTAGGGYRLRNVFRVLVAHAP